MVHIHKTRKGQAQVTVNGTVYTARLDPSARKWVVSTPNGDLWTNSPKLHSIGALFGQAPPSMSGGAPRVPRTPRAPRAPGRPKRGQAFATPKPNRQALALEALSKFEDLLVVTASENGVTAQLEKQFERYQKVKALAIGAGTTAPEALAAMRLALIEAVKLCF
jgi:hypothetical protein